MPARAQIGPFAEGVGLGVWVLFGQPGPLSANPGPLNGLEGKSDAPDEQTAAR